MHQLLLLPAVLAIAWIGYLLHWENKYLDPEYPKDTAPPKTLLDFEDKQ